MQYPTLKFDKFLGLYTRASRSNRPLGTVDDCLNLVPNTKTGKMCLRSGYTADISDAVTDVGGITITTIQNVWKYQTQVPTSTNISIVAGSGGGNNLLFQKPFFQKSATATDSWVNIEEYKTTTIATVTDFTTFTLTAGSTANDYYNGWIVWNSSKSESATVSDYTGSSKTVILDQSTGDGSHTGWEVADNVTLQRFAHNYPSFYAAFNFGTQPAWSQQNNDWVFSGGQSSDSSYLPIRMTYINKIFFPDVTNNTCPVQGTYIGYATPGQQSAVGLIDFNQSDDTISAETTDPLPAGFRYFVLAVLETFDGQKSCPNVISGTVNPQADISTQQRVDITYSVTPAFDKTIRWIHVFVGTGTANETSIDYSRYFLVKTIDLTASESFTWTYDDATVGNGWLKTINIKGADWAGRSTALPDYTGRSIIDGAATSYTGTPTFSLLAYVSGRSFISKFYDLDNAVQVDNVIRFSSIGDGISQYNIWPDNAFLYFDTIGYGDGSNITQLLAFESNLLIFKTGSVSYINVTDDPLTWTQVPIQKYSGCDAPYTVVTTPYGIVWANSGDDIYLWNGSSVRSLAKNWLTTFRAFTTTPTSWMGWYNEANKSYNLTCNMSDKTYWYEMFFELPLDDAFVWVRHQAADAITWVHTRVDGTVFFVKSSSDDTFYFNSAATADNATAIKPYFDTGDYVVDEGALISPKEWYLALSGQAGSPSGTLDAKLYVDGTAVTVGGSNPYTSLNTAYSRYQRPVPLINGTRIRFEFNTNATKASLGTALTIEELGIVYTLRTRKGDAVVA